MLHVHTEMIHDWEVYSIQQEVDPEVVRKSSADAEGIVALMRKIDLSPGEPIATGESTEAHDCKTHNSYTANTCAWLHHYIPITL